MNRYVWARSEPNRFATAIVGVMGPDGIIERINAGHHSGLLAKQGEVREVFQSECFPIGMFPEAEFCTSQAQLEPEDTLILFSDGLTEAENTSGDEFGMERVSAALEANWKLPPRELSAAILAEIAAFSKGAEQTDDMTLLVLRYRGGDH